ncbi:MAG TPA: sigma-70 family RNA polymerase sigma factor [Chitinophagaceae bacterium]|nr:sigma-70 family RNA polymerase sigma factor [Chitinophagaceae bacterium]
MDKATVSETEFRRWVEDHSDLLYSYALKRVTDEELCKDLVQETFLAAWRNKDAFRGDASVKNWLFQIIRSKIIDHFRKMNTRAMVHQIREDHHGGLYFDHEEHWRKGMYPAALSVNFESAIEQRDFLNVLDACGRKLKQVQHAVFVLKYVDELDSETICELMGLSSSNYWVLVHRAKVQLRACLEKNWLTK